MFLYIVFISLSLIFVFMSIHIGSAHKFFFVFQLGIPSTSNGDFHYTNTFLKGQPFPALNWNLSSSFAYKGKSPVREIIKKWIKRLRSVKSPHFILLNCYCFRSFRSSFVIVCVCLCLDVLISFASCLLLLSNSLSFESQSHFAKVS